MKKLFFSLVLSMFSLLMVSQTYNVIISGVVTDEITGVPVFGQEVNISTDSLIGGYVYYNTVTTNDGGYYEDIMEVPAGEQGMVTVSTMSCGAMLMQSGPFAPNNTQLIFDFQVCTNPGGNGCQAIFHYYSGDDSLSIQFIDDSWGAINSWTWDFGDGNTSTEQNPLHIYPATGDYLASLTISGDSCSSTTEMLVRVMNNNAGDCEAMFHYYPDNNNPNSIQFIDDSWGNIDNWTWDFGDGLTSTEQNPEHTYADEGEYMVILTVDGDSNQCYSVYSELVSVGDTIGPGNCQAMFYSYPDDADYLTINFRDMSMVGNGIVVSWHWDFGDGNTSEEQNPVNTYGVDGEYVVCLTIFSTGQGATCQSTHCENLMVGNAGYDCEAAFWYYPVMDTNNPNGGWNGLNTQFIDASTGNPDTWAWDFGDGTTSNEQNPVHLFPTEGNYNVCLSITNLADSCESTYCEDVHVFNDTTMGCFAWYEYEITDLTVDFQAFLEGGVDYVEYTWDFGDGAVGTGETISHTYAEDGIYEVALTATSGNCYAEYVSMIWVGDNFTFEVEGYVHLEDSIMADFADVHLMTFDTMGNGLINIATTQIDANGYYIFDGVGFEHCMYFVQAELTETSAYFGDYVPTYHVDAINWENAWPIFPYPMGWTYDIYMVGSVGSGSGNGIITGTVTEEGSRELLGNIEILLLDQEGKPMIYSRTNDEGVFSFSALAMATYVVYTEITGIETIPFDVTLNDQNNSSSVNIVVKNGQAILGIDDLSSAYIESVEAIYPNPVTANATFNISIKEPSNIKVEILNQYGQDLYSNELYLTTGKHKVNLPSTSFAQGMYFVKITADDNISSVRKFIKLR